MKSLRRARHHSSMTRAQFHCVWMSAGILSYQLCDRKFDCDRCPLDAAMRKHFGQTEAPRGGKPRAAKSSASSRYSFTRNHCWLLPKDDNVVRVGIEPGLGQILTSPKAVVFPRLGDALTRGVACLWVVLDGGTLPIASPVSGITHSVNTHLNEAPQELCVHPLTKGWLIDVEPSGKQWQEDGALKKPEVDGLYAADIQRFHTMVANALHAGKHEVGHTMQDGGRKLSDFLAMLGPREYFDLIRSVFGAGFQF